MIIDEKRIAGVKKYLLEQINLAKSQRWGNIIAWDRTFVSGGVIASLLQYEQPKDIDIYFKAELPMKEATVGLLQYLPDIKDVDDQYRDVIGTNGKMITERSITMSTGHSFISMHHGHPDDVRKTFDYLHCTPYYDVETNLLYISEAQYVAATQKILEVNNPKTFTNLRQNKFLKRGYKLGETCKQLPPAPVVQIDPYS